MNIKSVLESLMFAWGEPLSINEISKILNLPANSIMSVLKEMMDECNGNDARGLIIQKFGNSYQLTTKRENYEYIQNLLQSTVNKSLSTAAMEILSIIAYKQPVTKVEIELIRGVKCSQVVKGLLDKGLIKEAGKLDKPGRPTIYATTDEFLRHFGLSSIDELPSLPGAFLQPLETHSDIENEEEKKAT
jgi:segregation and condensation protein B